MAKLKQNRKKVLRKAQPFKGFYKSNGAFSKEKVMYEKNLVGMNPEGHALNSGY
jgi:hypothetical protein